MVKDDISLQKAAAVPLNPISQSQLPTPGISQPFPSITGTLACSSSFSSAVNRIGEGGSSDDKVPHSHLSAVGGSKPCLPPPFQVPAANAREVFVNNPLTSPGSWEVQPSAPKVVNAAAYSNCNCVGKLSEPSLIPAALQKSVHMQPAVKYVPKTGSKTSVQEQQLTHDALGLQFNAATAAGSLQKIHSNDVAFSIEPAVVNSVARKSYAAAVKFCGEAAPHNSRPDSSNSILEGPDKFPRSLRNQISAPVRSFHDADVEVMGQILDEGGRKSISFSASELEELAAPFEFSLIGKFSHGFPSMRVLKLQMANFNLKGECLISLLDQNHVLLRLSCEEDYTRLWCRQVLYITGFPMKMLKWSPNFSPGMEPPFAPVWVLLPYLPVHLFDRRSLFTICSAIGKPLRIDSATANLSRASTPRICVEIDLSKSLLSEIPISLDGKQFFQEVEYESLPKFCGRCKHLGHGSNKCLVLKSSAEGTSVVSQGIAQPATSHQDTVKVPTSPISPADSIFVSANGLLGFLPGRPDPSLDHANTDFKAFIANSVEVVGNVPASLTKSSSCQALDCGDISDSFDQENYDVKMHGSDGDHASNADPIILPPKKLLAATKGKSQKKQKSIAANPLDDEYYNLAVPQKDNIGPSEGVDGFTVVGGKNKQKKVKEKKKAS